MMDFDLNESLRQYKDDPFSVLTPEADAALVDCEDDPQKLAGGLVNHVLNNIVDSVAENPEAIAKPHISDSLQFILK